MNTKRLKFVGVIALVLAVTFVLGACDLGDDEVEYEEYDSVVTVENIEEAEHAEEFTLSAEDQVDTYTADDFDADDVEDGELEYTFSDLEGEATISLAIDNDELADGSYDDVDSVDVDADDSDVIFELSWEADVTTLAVSETDPADGATR